MLYGGVSTNNLLAQALATTSPNSYRKQGSPIRLSVGSEFSATRAVAGVRLVDYRRISLYRALRVGSGWRLGDPPSSAEGLFVMVGMRHRVGSCHILSKTKHVEIFGRWCMCVIEWLPIGMVDCTRQGSTVSTKNSGKYSRNGSQRCAVEFPVRAWTE